MKKTNRFLTIVMFIFLYIPMIVLVVASFNTGKDIANFEGFTLHRVETILKYALPKYMSRAEVPFAMETILDGLRNYEEEKEPPVQPEEAPEEQPKRRGRKRKNNS